MIRSVRTCSRQDALKLLSVHSLDRVWLGFDGGDEPSPLRESSEPSAAVPVADWDPDSPWRGHHGTGVLAPTIVAARVVVAWVLMWRADRELVDLYVHCHAGLFRSGAVAEWVRVDLGVPEASGSRRLVDVIDGEHTDRVYNTTLLRLLRAAHAEVGS